MTTTTERRNTAVTRKQIADALATVGITSKFKWRKDGTIEVEVTPTEERALQKGWVDSLENALNTLPGTVKPFEVNQSSYRRWITIRESRFTFAELRWYRLHGMIRNHGEKLVHRLRDITTQEQADTLLSELTQALNEWVTLRPTDS